MGREEGFPEAEPAMDSCPSHLSPPDEEYRPLFFYQKTTAQILLQALNPLNYRKWRTKPVYWRALKAFKVRGDSEPGSWLHDSTGQLPLDLLQSNEGRVGLC